MINKEIKSGHQPTLGKDTVTKSEGHSFAGQITKLRVNGQKTIIIVERF